MSDMKRLIEEHVIPIELGATNKENLTGLRPIRATLTHTLLAYCANEGIVLLDRRSRVQHIWTKAQIEAALFCEEG